MYRILALPWPRYTDAFKSNESSFEGGNLIVGHSQITKYGPRITWNKFKLQDMALG